MLVDESKIYGKLKTAIMHEHVRDRGEIPSTLWVEGVSLCVLFDINSS